MSNHKNDNDKKLAGMTSGHIWLADPIADLCLIGGEGLAEEEQGDLDNGDDSHPLWDERMLKPLKPEFIDNVNLLGVMVPVIVVVQDGVAMVVAGRRRVRAARVVNRQRKSRGEPSIKVECKLKRVSTPGALMTVMIAENEHREDDDMITKLNKLLRAKDNGVDDRDLMLGFGITNHVLKSWLDFYDHAADATKNAVEDGQLAFFAACELVKLAPDIEEQKVALKALLDGAAQGVRPTRQETRLVVDAKAKNTKKKVIIGIHDTQTQKRVLRAIEELDHSKSSKEAIQWHTGVEDAFRAIIGGDEIGEIDKRLQTVIASVHNQMRVDKKARMAKKLKAAEAKAKREAAARAAGVASQISDASGDDVESDISGDNSDDSDGSEVIEVIDTASVPLDAVNVTDDASAVA